MGETNSLPIVAATTRHRIGKTTYIVAASSSETATDTIEKKILKLIKKDVVQEAEKEPLPAKT
jgi:hypothetical protein